MKDETKPEAKNSEDRQHGRKRLCSKLLTRFEDENFEVEVLRSEVPVVVEIAAEWCGGCEIMAPILEKLAVAYKGRVKYGVVDIDSNQQIAAQYGATKLPIFLFFKNREIVSRISGAVSRDALESRINELLDLSVSRLDDHTDVQTNREGRDLANEKTKL